MEVALSLPFLVRKMLNFEHGATFGLRIRTQANRATALTIRGMTQEGIFTFALTTTGGGGIAEENFRIPDVPIFVTVTTTETAATLGQAFVAISLTVDGEIVQELTAGNVQTIHGISWPTQNPQNTRPNGGFLNVVSGTNPAAGVEIDEDVANNEYWKIKSIRLTLITDATAVSRRVHVVFQQGNTTILEVFSDVDQIESLNRNYFIAPIGDLPSRADDNDILIPMANDFAISDGMSISTETTNFQAGDNWGTPRFFVERFFI